MKILFSQEEKALEAARDELSRARAEFGRLRGSHRAADNRARNLAGIDPAGCAAACREVRDLGPAIGRCKAVVAQAEAKARRLEPAALARQARRDRPHQTRNGHSRDQSALAKAAHAAMLARMGYVVVV